jgi:hypothetical protein
MIEQAFDRNPRKLAVPKRTAPLLKDGVRVRAGVACLGTGGVDARRAHYGRFDAHDAALSHWRDRPAMLRGTPMRPPILHPVRTKHPRMGLLALALGLSALLAVAAPVYAAEPVGVDIQGCSLSGGTTTVPAGADIDLFAGWSAQTRGQELAFLYSVQTTLSINGDAVAGADNWWSTPFEVFKGFWVVFWDYPLSALGVGDSVTVHHVWTLRQPVFDGVNHLPRGTTFDSTCTITGVAS